MLFDGAKEIEGARFRGLDVVGYEGLAFYQLYSLAE
jgi:hypothetical protein